MDNLPEIRTHDLLPGERVLWTGMPKPGIRFQGPDIAPIAFGCVFTGFALFWTTMAFTMTRAANTPTGFRILFPLFGVPFILVGLFVMFGGTLARAIKAKKTVYAITERRVITVIEGGNRIVHSVDLERILSTKLSEGKDGSGSIAYSVSSRDIDRMAAKTGVRDASGNMALEGIDNASNVFSILESARATRSAQVGPYDP